MPDEDEEFHDGVEENSSAARHVATNYTQTQDQASSPSSMTATLPIGQRTWMPISASNQDEWDNDRSAYRLSKTVFRVLRHKDQLREADGAVEWEKVCVEYSRESLC